MTVGSSHTESIEYGLAPTSLGVALLAATDRGVRFIALGEDADALRETLAQEYPQARLWQSEDLDSPCARWMQPLRASLAGEAATLDRLPLDMRGTAFQRQVWAYLRGIPSGETRSYAQAAREWGCPTATRAVAGACAANRLAIVIPCHRVIRSDGGLGGYRWGLSVKRALLQREQAQCEAMPEAKALARL